MPEFDNLQPVIRPTDAGNGILPINPSIPQPTSPFQQSQEQRASAPQENNSYDLLEQLSNNATHKGEEERVGFDTLKTPNNQRYASYNPDISNQEDYKAEGQSGWDRAGNAGFQFVNKVGAYLTQTAGFIGGAVGATVGGAINLTNQAFGGSGKVVSGGNAISNMTDNFVDKLADSWKDTVQENNPIYKTDKYTNGNIWAKLGTTSWWLDDAMDRLALTGAMLVPGVLEAKGVGLFGTAVKAGESMEATGMGAKAIKAMADNPELYGQVGKALGNAVYKSAVDGSVDLVGNAALNFKNVMKGAQTMELTTFNVIGQNALNGREAQTSIRKTLQDQRDQGLNTLSDSDIEDKAAKGAIESFWYNMPLTALSSAWELPQIFSSMKGGQNILKRLGNVDSMEELEQGLSTIASSSSKPGLLKTLGKAGLTALEHGQLESSQVAIGRYIENAIAGKTVNGKVETDEDNPLMGSIKEYINNFSDPNGQNNIALGTIQGLLTTIFGRAYKGYKGEYKAEDTRNANFIDHINQAIAQRRFFNAPENMMVKNDDGSVKMENDKPVFDQSKLSQLGASYANHVKNYYDRLDALKNGDKTAIDQMNFDSLSGLARDFFQDAKGKDYLINVLKFENKNQNLDPSRTNDIVNGQEHTPNSILQESIDHVENLYRAYNAIDQRHAGFLNLKIDYSNPDEVNSSRVFTEAIKDAQYNTAADQLFYNQKIRKNNLELGQLGIQEKVDKPSSPIEERANEIINENARLTSNLNQAKDIYKQLINRTQINAAWEQKKTADLAVKDFIKQTQEKPEDTSEPIGQDVAVKTKDGDETLKTGTEYYLGKVVKYDGKGNEVYSFPKLTILKENEDGTIRIQDGNGNIKDVSKDVLLDYKLGKVSDLQNNKKAKYYFDNINSIFQFNFGKGETRKGRLQYSPKDGILEFVYKDSRGKVKSIEVTGDQFVAKKGFNNPMIEKLGTLTAEERSQTAEFAATPDDRISAKREARLRIINDLVDETTTRLEGVRKAINEKHRELDFIQKDLTEIKTRIESSEDTKRGNFKMSTKRALRTATKLTNLKESLQTELEALTNDESELSFDLSYFQGIAKNIDELPTGSKDFIEELNDQVIDLEILRDGMHDSIKSIHSLIGKVEKALESAIKMVKDAIRGFEVRYPKAPFNADTQEFVDFIKANPNFLKLNTNYKSDIKTLEGLVAQVEDLDIKPNERTVNELMGEVAEIENGLQILDRQYDAKLAILNRFAAAAKEYKEEQVIKKSLVNNDSLKEVLSKVQTTITKQSAGDPPTNDNETDLAAMPREEKRKTLGQLINSTTEPSSDADRKDWHNRHQYFIARVNGMANKENIQAIKITKNNEKAWGLDGLIDHMNNGYLAESDISDKTKGIVAVVYGVKNADDSISLIDKNGKSLSTPSIDTAVYAAMGDAQKNWSAKYGSGAKYRNTDNPEQVDAAFKLYEEERAKTFAITTKEDTHSFGFQVSDGKPILDENKKAQNPVVGSIITDSKLLNNKDLVRVSTTGKVENHNGDSISVPKGRPVLVTSQGLSYLNNRNFTESEATNIVNALKQLAKEYYDKKEINPDIQRYLQGQFQWRVPGANSTIADNQLYIDAVTGSIMIGKDMLSEFHPKLIEGNRVSMTSIIQKKFNNVSNSFLTKEFEQPFNELSIDENGKTVTTKWRSYQHYLLSPKTPDGAERQNSTPLYTRVRMLKGKDIVNDDYNFQRYTTLSDLEVPQIVPKVVEKKAPFFKKQAPVEVKKEEPSQTETTQSDINTKIAAIIPDVTLPFIDDKLLTKQEDATFNGKVVGKKEVPNQAVIDKQNDLRERARKLDELIKCLLS